MREAGARLFALGWRGGAGEGGGVLGLQVAALRLHREEMERRLAEDRRWRERKRE